MEIIPSQPVRYITDADGRFREQQFSLRLREIVYLVRSLLDDLSSDNVDAREAVARTLCRLMEGERGLVRATWLPDDAQERQRLMQFALQQQGAPAIEPLIRLLRSAHARVRADAAQILGLIGDEAAVEPLIEVYRYDTSKVRWRVAQALGELRDARALDPLLKTLETEKDFVRWRIAQALGKIGHPDAVPGLIASLADPHDGVRTCAAEALGMIGDARAVEPLMERLDADAGAWRRVVEALGNLGDSRALAPLQALKLPENDLMRLAARAARAKLGDSAALARLADWLDDSRAKVRDYALKTFLQIGSPAVPLLLKRIKEPAHPYRREMIFALGQIDDGRVIGALLGLLREPETAPDASAALEAFGAPESLPLKVLCETRMPLAERYQTLQTLRDLHYMHHRTLQIVRFSLPNVAAFCRQLLENEDSLARAEAQAMLNYCTLLRAVERDPAQEAARLVRPVKSGNASAPDTLLRPADASPPLLPVSRPGGLLARLFRRRG